jgi:hypothetical protein
MPLNRHREIGEDTGIEIDGIDRGLAGDTHNE